MDDPLIKKIAKLQTCNLHQNLLNFPIRVPYVPILASIIETNGPALRVIFQKSANIKGTLSIHVERRVKFRLESKSGQIPLSEFQL